MTDTRMAANPALMTPESVWAERAAQTGKSMALMKEFERIIAEYGDEALVKWQISGGLREKPRIRVRAISA